MVVILYSNSSNARNNCQSLLFLRTAQRKAPNRYNVAFWGFVTATFSQTIGASHKRELSLQRYPRPLERRTSKISYCNVLPDRWSVAQARLVTATFSQTVGAPHKRNLFLQRSPRPLERRTNEICHYNVLPDRWIVALARLVTVTFSQTVGAPHKRNLFLQRSPRPLERRTNEICHYNVLPDHWSVAQARLVTVTLSQTVGASHKRDLSLQRSPRPLERRTSKISYCNVLPDRWSVAQARVVPATFSQTVGAPHKRDLSLQRSPRSLERRTSKISSCNVLPDRWRVAQGCLRFHLLSRIQLIIPAAPNDELVVRAALGDALVRDVQDAVAVLHRRQTVRDDERGAALQQLVQASLQQTLRLGIDRRRRFVEDQDARVGEQRAGERDELALALGQLRAAFVHFGHIALLELADELVRAYGLGRRDDFFFRGVELAVTDVVQDRAGEDEAVLQHNAHLAAQRLQLYARDIVSVNQNAAVRDIIEARDQVDDGRLAGTRRADQRDAFACLDVEAQSLKDVNSRIVRERHVVEGDLAADRRQLASIRDVADGHRFVERLEDALQVCDGVNEAVVDVRQVQDRLPEPPRVTAHGEDDAVRHLRRVQHEQSYEIDGRGDDRRQVIHRERDEEVEVHRSHPRRAVVAGELVEDLLVALLAREDLRDANAADALLQIGVQVGAFVRYALPCASLLRLEQQHDGDEHRHARQNDER